MREFEVIITALCAQVVTLNRQIEELRTRVPLRINVPEELEEAANRYGQYCYENGRIGNANYLFTEWRRRVLGGEDLEPMFRKEDDQT